MDENYIKQLPLEFKKIKIIKKENLKEEKVIYSKIEFYQSNRVISENFYKHISKIISFEIEK